MHFLGLVAASLLLAGATSASPLEPANKRHASSPKPVCDLVGYDRERYIIRHSQCSLSQCASVCKSDKKCKSHGYGKKTCRLYSAPAKTHVAQKQRSSYKFYDSACSPPVTTTTAKSTTAKSTTAKSTTVDSISPWITDNNDGTSVISAGQYGAQAGSRFLYIPTARRVNEVSQQVSGLTVGKTYRVSGYATAAGPFPGTMCNLIITFIDSTGAQMSATRQLIVADM